MSVSPTSLRVTLKAGQIYSKSLLPLMAPRIFYALPKYEGIEQRVSQMYILQSSLGMFAELTTGRRKRL